MRPITVVGVDTDISFDVRLRLSNGCSAHVMAPSFTGSWGVLVGKAEAVVGESEYGHPVQVIRTTSAPMVIESALAALDYVTAEFAIPSTRTRDGIERMRQALTAVG